jgi:hypothetical protein
MKVLFRSAFFFTILSVSIGIGTSHAQSTNQNFPTPVTSSEISGTIKARDVGDARLTSYFYQFDGDQGDLFINVVARNFTGDIDVFTVSGLKPLTKIVLYADFGENETGRVIYLRKPEKMILRVQGRTPGDDPATFRIKFAGSFVASTQSEPAAEPELPTLTAKNESGIRVNSVGTIVEIIPKATPTPAPVAAVSKTDDERTDVETEKEKADADAKKIEDKTIESPAETPEKKHEVVVTDNIPEKKETVAAAPPVRRRIRGRAPAKRTAAGDTESKSTAKSTDVRTVLPPRSRRGQPPAKTTTAKEPDPLEKINLIILFKDGTTVERPMSQVLRFTVDKGVLTVISKDGSIGRYSILDVEKVTIQ